MSTVLKPPERGITPAKIEACTRSTTGSAPKVAGLVHSKAPIVRIATASTIRVVVRVIFVCRGQVDGTRHLRESTSTTGKPRLPTKTATAIGRVSQRSPTYGVNPRLSSTNPALLNDDTA